MNACLFLFWAVKLIINELTSSRKARKNDTWRGSEFAKKLVVACVVCSEHQCEDESFALRSQNGRLQFLSSHHRLCYRFAFIQSFAPVTHGWRQNACADYTEYKTGSEPLTTWQRLAVRPAPFYSKSNRGHRNRRRSRLGPGGGQFSPGPPSFATHTGNHVASYPWVVAQLCGFLALDSRHVSRGLQAPRNFRLEPPLQWNCYVNVAGPKM